MFVCLLKRGDQNPPSINVKLVIIGVHSAVRKFSDMYHIKFIYSEKATQFCEISTVDLSYRVLVKSTVEISQNFVAFSEHMNFKIFLIFSQFIYFTGNSEFRYVNAFKIYVIYFYYNPMSYGRKIKL